MSSNVLQGESSPTFSSRILRFPDFEVSWAGKGPLDVGLCFGSEDGRLLMTGEDGSHPVIASESPIPSREAINGIAFSNDHAALSTRDEIVLVSQIPIRGKSFRSVVPIGAHGVIATPSGRFVAPLGRGGVMSVVPSRGEHQAVTISHARDRQFNFYKAVNVPVPGREIVASAARFGGVTATDYSTPSPSRMLHILKQINLDVVDVCALGENLAAPAAAAVSRDCTIIISKDLFSDDPPVTLKFPKRIEGAAYRLMSARGHLYLLTSKALYQITGIVTHFHAGQNLARIPLSIRTMSVEAVDANLIADRWLLVVRPNDVMRIDLNLFAGSIPESDPTVIDQMEDSVPIDLDWESNESYSEEFQSPFAFA